MEEYTKEYMKWAVENKHLLVPDAFLSLKKLKKAGLLVSLLTSRDKKTLFLHLNDVKIPIDIFFFVQSPNGYSLQVTELKTFEPTIKQFEQIGIPKEKLVYVGDTRFDLYAARASEIKFIGVLTGAATKQEFKEQGVQNILESIADLPEFLDI